MPLYKRQQDIDEDIEDNVASTNTELDSQQPTLVNDDGNWKKRYGDLRSYSQKQINELNKKIKDLEISIESSKQLSSLPKKPEEVEEWAKKYPDVYGMIKSMINLDLIEATKSVNERFQSIEEEKHELAKERALNQIIAEHPDFYDIAEDDTFKSWIVTKSKRIQDALFENDTDAQAAIEALNLYKFETGKLTNKKIKAERKPSAAADVRVPNSRTPVNTGGQGEYDFTESQISAMSIREYEKNEQAIETARRAGRIYYDETGAAQ